MPLYIGSATFDDTTARRKDIALFSYPSTTVDLSDGMVIDALLTTTTYGAGKSVQKGTLSKAYVIGPVDHAVDVSTTATAETGFAQEGPHRLIKVVVAGVKVDTLCDGSVSAGDPVMCDGNAYGTTATVGSHDGYVFGVALEDDAGAGSGADCLIYPRWFV